MLNTTSLRNSFRLSPCLPTGIPRRALYQAQRGLLLARRSVVIPAIHPPPRWLGSGHRLRTPLLGDLCVCVSPLADGTRGLDARYFASGPLDSLLGVFRIRTLEVGV